MRSSVWLSFWGSFIAIHSIFGQSQTSFSSDSLLTNIAVDNTNGNVYLGGTNVIIKLTSDLSILQSVETGTKLDNPKCWPPAYSPKCSETRIPTDNFNKILILYEQKNQLIACGSMFQGFCELRNLSSLSLIEVNSAGYFIASSNNQSAVGMLAPNKNGALKFYVGATWKKSDIFSTSVDEYICVSRNIDEQFEVYSEEHSGSKGVGMKEDAMDNWETQFKYIFSSPPFSYFLFTIGEKLKAKHSVISRVCQKDGTYDSYVQIPLQCNSTSGANYNLIQSAFVSKAGVVLATNLGIKQEDDVLFTVFAKSASTTSNDPTRQSAVCVYSVKDINRMFRTNIERCIKGTTKMGLPWFNRYGGDVCKSDEISKYDCTLPNQKLENKHLGGDKAVTASPVLEYSKSILTSVVAIAVGSYTAVFVGTGNGILLKMSVKENNKLHTPYEEINLLPSGGVQKLVFGKDRKFVFAVASKKVVKMPVQECLKYKTCDACTGKGDAFCGWCTLENRCTMKSNCSNSNLDLRFVQTPDKCVKFSSISPDRVPREQVTELVLTMENLPALRAPQTYKCYINNKEQLTVVALPVIKCTTPAAADLPPITSDTGDVKVDLALKSSETAVQFAVTKLAFFNCDRISDCFTCTEGRYVCNWCVYKGQCSASANPCDADDILVKAKQNRTAGEPLCPQLTANQELLVPSNVPTTFVVKGKHLPTTKAGFAYQCSVKVEGSVQTAAAEWNSDTQLTCKDAVFSYTEKTQYHSRLTTLNVLWHKTDKIGNPHNVSVSLYKCDVDRESCSICWASDQKLKCGWCRSGDSCTVERACASPNKWTGYPQSCNIKPRITKFWPTAGPTAGGTEVEISGQDLGKRFEDIQKTVQVAGFQCKPDRAKYEVSHKILCNTTDTRQNARTSGFIYVTVDGLRGSSVQEFVFQNPILRDFFPKKGPQSGGSLINITGDYLNTGRYIRAYLAGVPCTFNRKDVTQTSLLCRTNPSSKRVRKRAAVSSGKVVLVFDGYKPPPPPGVFEFTPDPTVSDISPPKTFVSGGQKLTISGDNFGSIQQPKIFFKRGDGGSSSSEEEECQRLSDTEIVCPSPNASALGVVPSSNNGSEVCVGFIMDDVKKLLNCSMFLAIVEDPVFLPFEGPDQVRRQKDNQLILKGRNLDIITKSDVQVTVQTTNCTITDLQKELLLCLIPKEENLQTTDDARYPVKVYVGNLVFGIGKLEYFRLPVATDRTMYFIIAGAVGVVLLLLIVFLVCYNRRKQKKSKKKADNIARELETLESKVARECREAFAELQTDVTDLTSDLTTLGMPFLEFRYYALRVLFPNQEDHPVLHEKEGYAGHNWEAGLRQFTKLIHNKNFLLVFIRTLEAQVAFNMRDRCDVASLLMVTLQGKMEYATEILRQLLCELIKKSVAKSHPKLLLRRTESVAEKMLSDWLAFCMYNYLKQEAGEPLFVLFKAIKRQVEKGPVDAVTGEARYSLSEDRLLRQTVEFKKVTVSVEYDDSEPETVVLLDCDSIGQAKEKILDAIYKNKPYSGRLGRDTLQLEWLHPGGRVRPLRDDDNSSEVDNEWRRVNTLSHYKIADDDKLRLTAQQSYFYSPVSISESSFNRSMPSLGFTPTSYTPLAQSDAALEQGGRSWHLVKQMDYPSEKEDPGQGKMLSEIYLTRLLSTKGTLQQFVDHMFKTVFSASRQGTRLPLAVKFLFDLLDDQARDLNLEDEEVLHMWKNNSLPLRFWINIIKNPNFIFDIEKSGIVDSCLSVIAQLFMDSCSVSVDTLGTDSPSNKLLYAREIPDYNKRVKRFYTDISELPRPTTEELSDYFADMSMQFSSAFNVDNALKELYVYAKKYQEKLQEAFEECGQSSLATKLEHVIATIEDS